MAVLCCKAVPVVLVLALAHFETEIQEDRWFDGEKDGGMVDYCFMNGDNKKKLNATRCGAVVVVVVGRASNPEKMKLKRQ